MVLGLRSQTLHRTSASGSQVIALPKMQLLRHVFAKALISRQLSVWQG